MCITNKKNKTGENKMKIRSSDIKSIIREVLNEDNEDGTKQLIGLIKKTFKKPYFKVNSQGKQHTVTYKIDGEVQELVTFLIRPDGLVDVDDPIGAGVEDMFDLEPNKDGTVSAADLVKEKDYWKWWSGKEVVGEMELEKF